MRYQVPQFIEVEDKIFGPLTFKQFVYLAGGGGICVLLFMFLPKILAILIAAPIGGFALALAFYKINDKPFINVVEAFFKYSLTNKLYIWKKEDKIPNQTSTSMGAKLPIDQVHVPKLSDSKLSEITWKLDIKENQNPVTDDDRSKV